MTKYVTDTKAGQSLEAFIVFDKHGEYVAKVHVHYSAAGVCTVNIYDNVHGFQVGKASGYGYDKKVSALSGLIINGVTLYNHCGFNAQTAELLKRHERLKSCLTINVRIGSLGLKL